MIDTPPPIELDVAEAEAGLRLDRFAAGEIDGISRSAIQSAIKEGRVTLNGTVVRRPSRTVAEGDSVVVALPPAPATTLEPEDIPLDVLYEDDALIVLNKPAGLVVHPAPGHPSGTLVNAVLHHCNNFHTEIGDRDEETRRRPGIVHRLDRDTSGVMVVAKTPQAFEALARQAREHTFDRQYVALVAGEFDAAAGVVDVPVGRTVTDRKRMGANTALARPAVTRYQVAESFGVASLVRLQLETGRTHQIRVHMRYIGRPVLGDPVYGVTDFTGWEVSPDAACALKNLQGQALHAERLGFVHPVTGKKMRFNAPMPHDIQRAIASLRLSARGKRGA